jgi:hypothetical protein
VRRGSGEAGGEAGIADARSAATLIRPFGPPSP